MLEGKKILLGVTGSIAAYKSAVLTRLLVRAGAEVKVIMTPGALEFVTPLTFSTLSKHPVHSDFTEDRNSGKWTNHVMLANWADVMVIAPLSASTLAKMATGMSDNFFMTVYMSAPCRVLAAPAMDHDMWLHQGTKENLARIKEFGHTIIVPAEGELASGLYGQGRMAEPEEIFMAVAEHFNPALPLKGKRALVTAGPTYEKIDPVRFIGNFSTGKMGFEIAEALAEQGAVVDLVYGPGPLSTSNPMIRTTRVTSAEEMRDRCKAFFPDADITVLAAAVSDYRPEQYADQKIKKTEDHFSLAMTKNPDIAMELADIKKKGQFVVGFALETENEKENAVRKFENKKFDLLVLNSLNDAGAGFGTDTNKITLFWAGNNSKEFGLKAKSRVARDIVEQIIGLSSK